MRYINMHKPEGDSYSLTTTKKEISDYNLSDIRL